MGNCRNCKCWGEGEKNLEPEHRYCGKLSQVVDTLIHYQLPPLTTPPDFGCTLFEGKPEPELSPGAEDARKWCG